MWKPRQTNERTTPVKLVSGLTSLFIAGALLFSGIVHATQPYLFIHTVASYRLLPQWLVGVTGLWLPYLQLTLAVCLAFNIAERVVLRMSACLFAVFATAQLTVLIRGIEIDCGCFGYAASTVSVTTLSVPALLFAASVTILYFGAPPESGELATDQERNGDTVIVNS